MERKSRKSAPFFVFREKWCVMKWIYAGFLLSAEIQTLYELRQENRDIHRLGVQYEQERRRIWRDCMSRLDKAYEMLEEKEDFGTVRNTLDLCSLFCNLIDNAIEASEKITDGDTERFIKISAGCRSGFLILRVENTAQQVPEFKNGVCRTSKSTDKELHGLG